MPTRNTQPGLLLLAILLLSACGSDPGFDEDTDFVTLDGFVQFVNMMPDSPEVIVLHGLERTAVGFPQAHPIEVRPVDKYDWRIAYLNSNDDEVTVAEQDNQQISADGLSTFLIMGSVQQANVQIVDAPFIASADRPAGVSDIWFASNLANYSMVDIYLTDFGADLADAVPLTTVTSGSFTDRITVDAESDLQLRVTTAGTKDVLFDSGTLEIPEKTEDLYGLVDDFGPNGANHVNVIRSLTALGSTIRDESQPASVRLGNYSEQPVITATLGSASYPNVIRRTRSETQQTTNGVVDFLVTAPDDSVLEESQVTIARGSFQSIYTFQNNTELPTSVTRSLNIGDAFRVVRDRSLFKFINGSNEVIDVYVLRPGQEIDQVAPFLNNIGFAGTQNSESVTGNIEYVVRNSENTETLTSLSATLQEEVSYTLVYDTEGILHLLAD